MKDNVAKKFIVRCFLGFDKQYTLDYVKRMKIASKAVFVISLLAAVFSFPGAFIFRNSLDVMWKAVFINGVAFTFIGSMYYFEYRRIERLLRNKITMTRH